MTGIFKYLNSKEDHGYGLGYELCGDTDQCGNVFSGVAVFRPSPQLGPQGALFQFLVNLCS